MTEDAKFSALDCTETPARRAKWPPLAVLLRALLAVADAIDCPDNDDLARHKYDVVRHASGACDRNQPQTRGSAVGTWKRALRPTAKQPTGPEENEKR